MFSMHVGVCVWHVSRTVVDAWATLQVARELQAVCRPNPRKARVSCTREAKRAKSSQSHEDKVLEQSLVISSGSDVEIVAMDQDSGPAFGRGYWAKHTCTQSRGIMFCMQHAVMWSLPDLRLRSGISTGDLEMSLRLQAGSLHETLLEMHLCSNLQLCTPCRINQGCDEEIDLSSSMISGEMHNQLSSSISSLAVAGRSASVSGHAPGLADPPAGLGFMFSCMQCVRSMCVPPVCLRDRSSGKHCCMCGPLSTTYVMDFWRLALFCSGYRRCW